MNSIVGSAQVICTTLVGSTSKMIRDMDFGCVVIDEAGQALEPLCWVPILKARKVVLSGDPHQLPPTVKSHEAQKAGLGKTLLEKVIAKQMKKPADRVVKVSIAKALKDVINT